MRLPHVLALILAVTVPVAVEARQEGGVVGQAPPPLLTDRLFVELFGESGLGDEGEFSSADAGLTWLLLHNVQLDLSGGVGLSTSADDWFAGLGVSFRLPR